MNDSPQRTYRPGADLLLSGSRLTVLLPSPSAEHMAELWQLVDGPGDLDDLLEWLVDRGFRTFPSFLAVEHGAARGPRLLLRGPAAVVVARADGGQESFTGEGRRTWLDVAVPDAVRLWTSGPAAEGVDLPLRHGVARAGGFALDLPATPTAPAAADTGGTVAATAHASRQQSVDVAADRGTSAAPEATAEPPGQDRSTAFPDATADPEEGITLAPPVPVDDPDADADAAASTAVADAAAVIDSADLPGLELTGPDQFEQVFGATRRSTVEHAAVRIEDEPEADEEGEPAPAGPASAIPEGPPQPAEGDHDGRTISTAELARLRGAARVPGAAGPGVAPAGRVRAALCGNGHPNPPSETICRVCGDPLDQAALHTVDRPVLGVLAFTDGPRATLEGTLIIGRSPKMPTTKRSEVPTLVTVDSPEGGVSRSHLEARVEGWSVSVVDLGTTNGTEVTLPGEQPRRLRRGEPCLITPGTRIVLGDEVSATYQAGP